MAEGVEVAPADVDALLDRTEASRSPRPRADVGALRRLPILTIAGLAVGFAALAVLVATGSLDGLDRFAVDHLMPGLEPRNSGKPRLLDALSPVGRQRGPFHFAADAWLYPASVPVSGLVVAVAAAALWRRGARGRRRSGSQRSSRG